MKFLDKNIANGIGIGCGFILNYTLSDRWVYSQ